jgi:hypothetical protein
MMDKNKRKMYRSQKTKSTKCSDHCTISLTAHTAKIEARVLRRWTERKIERGLGKNQF